MLLSEIDKAFDDLQDFMRIYIELYAQDRSIEPNHGRFPRYIGGKINPLYFDEMRWYASKRKPSFNMPQFKDYETLNKPLSKDSYRNVAINKGTHLGIAKQYYNFWIGFKYHLKLKTYDTI